MNDKDYEALGFKLIEILNLKVKKERVDTAWGTKTPVGLGKTVERLIDEIKKEKS